LPLLGAGLCFDHCSFDNLAVAILTFATVAAAVTRTTVTFLALAIGRRRGVAGHGLPVRGHHRRRFARGLTFWLRARPFVTAAATPLTITGTALAGRTAGPPHLDHLGLGRRRFRRSGSSAIRAGGYFRLGRFRSGFT
jgi:hypothetical protein